MTDPNPISIRFTQEELDALDAIVLGAPRGTWIKALVRACIDARERFGRPCGLGVVACEEFPEGFVGVNERMPPGRVGSGHDAEAAPEDSEFHTRADA